MRSAGVAESDRTSVARIRDAALVRFAEDGFAGTTVRAVAAEAGVSPALVMHHFGSKDGLRAACDSYVVELVEAKFAAIDTELGNLGAMGSLLADGLPAIRYLARAVAEGGAAADRLVDSLVVLADQQLARWSATGAVRPSADPQMRAVVLVVWDLAVLVLARHVHRASGSDPFTAAGLTRWSNAVLELLHGGLLADHIDPTTLELP